MGKEARINASRNISLPRDSFRKALMDETLLQEVSKSRVPRTLSPHEHSQVRNIAHFYDFGDFDICTFVKANHDTLIGSFLKSPIASEFEIPHKHCFYVACIFGTSFVIELSDKGLVIDIDIWTSIRNRAWIRRLNSCQIDKKTSGITFAHNLTWDDKLYTHVTQTYGGVVCLLTMLLMTPPEANVVTYLPESDAPRLTLSPRSIAPLPPVRMVRIDMGAVARYVRRPIDPDSAQGTPKSPHDRRGHFRTYKRSGLRKWIEPMAIKGGATSPRPVLVTVANLVPRSPASSPPTHGM